MSRSTDFPSEEEGLALHARVQALDGLAPAAVCQAYLEPLLNWLNHHCPFDDPDLRTTAAGVALFCYVQHPNSYHPERGDLGMFLRMAARGDLANLRREEQRHHRRRISWIDVEMGEDGGNFSRRENDPVCLLQRDEEQAAQQDFLDELRRELSPRDRAVLDLLREGQLGTQPFIGALGLEDRPLEEQILEVKRAKDRIKKRIERGGASNE